MRDEETLSLWDHITGECFDGPLSGQRLAFWGTQLTLVAAALAEYPDIILLKSDYKSFGSFVMKNVVHRSVNINANGTHLPPGFRNSMSGEIDGRLPYGTQGLGVMDDLNAGKFYPLDAIPQGGTIEDEWLGRPLQVSRGAVDGVLSAVWTDTNEAPMQLTSRWYGFAFTFPDCEIYAPD